MWLLRLLNMARCKLPGPERQRARRMRWHSPHTWPVEKVEPRQSMEKPSQHWMKNVSKDELKKSANCSSELALSATSILPPGIMIIQWEFRFPVLRIFRELCKQSKEMGTGSEDANRMPIEFSLQLAFCWQMVIKSWKSAAKFMCHPTSFEPFRSQDSDALCNHEGPPLRLASVPPRERTCQDPATTGYWLQIL